METFDSGKWLAANGHPLAAMILAILENHPIVQTPPAAVGIREMLKFLGKLLLNPVEKTPIA
ncbi:hypothetical protein [Bremerella cremea]|uniref:hypothetical protein n=1 Tax=Bremerella cremea TaxID=1031537 RepID=UPI0031E66604